MKSYALAFTGLLALVACQQPTNPGQIQFGSISVVSNASSTTGVTTVIRNSGGQVVGPNDTGSLLPGTYSISFSRDGYTGQQTTAAVTANQISTVTIPALVINQTPNPSTRGVSYVGANGQLISIDLNTVNPDSFVFYSWLEDNADGINRANLGAVAPTVGEQDEVAPSRVQNVASAYVGFRGPGGVVFPVVGATVRWGVLDLTSSVRFGAADDGGNDTGFQGGIVSQSISAAGLQADTITNRATVRNTPYPSSAGQTPLYNMTGVGSPNVDGYTWTTLFSPDSVATSRVLAVGFVGDVEIGKQTLTKQFAPSARLSIEKTPETVASVLGAPATNFVITVRNTGEGAANNVTLTDRLTTGADATYSIGAVTSNPAGTTSTLQGDSGFNSTFSLAPNASISFTVPATATAEGQYCDTATITGYTNGTFGNVAPVGLSDTACLVVTAPKVNIVKQFVDANGAVIPGNVTIPLGGTARLRVNVTNSGSAPATNVNVTDVLSRVNGTAVTTDNAAYSISGTLPTGATANTRDGFSVAPLTLVVGETRSFIFNVTSSADGTYCDVASFTADGGQSGQSEVCLVVQTARLVISKTNTPTTGLVPGSTYNSSITVNNTGTADAVNVAVSDLIGANGSQFVNFGSGNFSVTNAANANVISNGTVALSGNTVSTTPATVTIPAGGRLTFNLTSSIPAGAPAGDYCNVARFTSSNSVPANAEVRACVTVIAFAAIQTTMVDREDPVTRGNDLNTSAVLSNEPASNEILNGGQAVFVFGTLGNDTTTAGLFPVKSIQVFFDAAPTRNTQGLITSDQTRPGAVLLNVGTDYTVDAATPTGRQIVTFNRELPVSAAFFVLHNVNVPAATPARQYQSNLDWKPVGKTSGTVYQGFDNEPTTILP